MNKTVLITGASGGIGKATVEVFLQAGWQVAAGVRTLAESTLADSDKLRVYELDVTQPQSIQAAFTAIIKDFGGIDVVVNNAGYGLDGIFEGMTDDQIRGQFEVNVFGLMNVTREAIKTMRTKGRGTIVQIASMGGRLAFPGYSVYHATKWAVEGFTEALQYELRPVNIRVKIIEPGVINTAFYGKSRVAAATPDGIGYEAFAASVSTYAQNAGAHGERPERVARTILKAAQSKSSKLRYVVGAPAPALFIVRRLLPERVFFWGVRKIYKI